VAALGLSAILKGPNPVDSTSETIVLQPASTVVVATPVPTAVPVYATAVPTEVPAAATDVPATQAPAPVQQQENYGAYQILSGIPQTDHAIGLPMTEQVPDAYFNDSVFIGDSVSLKLSYYVKQTRQGYASLLGNAQFLCAGSMGSGNAMEPVSDSSIHPSFRGQKTTLEDAVAAMGAKKVFIMLGMNDIAIYGPEQAAQNMMQLISRIKAKSPNVQIFVQSATPKLFNNPNHKLNNNTLFEYDLKLYELCKSMESQGVYFLDIAYVMRDGQGNLPANYCSDPEDQALHFTDEACKLWIQYLYTHALI
jgi:lysophospholipase L1-like esterase